MISVKVKKQGVVTHAAKFATQGEADEWISQQVALKSFGKPERWVDEFDCANQGEVIADALAEQLVGGPDAEHKQYKFAAQYEIEQEDITAQVAQQATNEASLKYLAETDWYVIRNQEVGTAIPEEILTARAAARAAIVR